MKRSHLAVAVLLVSFAGGVANADHDIGVVVTGEATIQPQLASQLELWMTKTGHKLVATPLAPDAVNAIVDCFVIEDEGCARQVFEKRSKAPTIVYARADVQVGSSAMERDVTLTAYWFERGKASLTIKKKRCERCNEEKLRAAADELAAEIAGASGKVGHLKAKSNPVGADVLVGNRKMGVTPLEQPLAPGTYKVVVGEESRDVTVVAGQTVDLDIALTIHGGGGGSKSRGTAVATLVTGIAMVATGGILFAISPADTGKQEEGGNTSRPGMVVGAAGIVVTGVGIYLLARKPSRRSSPVGAITPTGGFVGWAGRF